MGDHDPSQAIYPRDPNATSTGIPVRGPDSWCAGKYWLVEGACDDIIPVRVEVEDGRIEVLIGSKTFQSIPGWGRHDYYLKALTQSTCSRMDMAEPGIFKCRGVVSDLWSEELQGCVESFQILVDADE